MGQITGYFQDMWAGPGHLRFFVQPTIALLLGIRDGYRDARQGSPPYLFGLIKVPEGRADRLREGLKSILIPLVLGFILSSVFQYVIRGRILLAGALLFAAIFVASPYVVARSFSNRLSRRLPALRRGPARA